MGREGVDAERHGAGDQPDDGEEHERAEHVGRGRRRLGDEEIGSARAPGEDALERAVLVLGGDDVAGDERRHGGKEEEGGEDEGLERQGQPGDGDVAAEDDVRIGAVGNA
jgi:hypothetical protein